MKELHELDKYDLSILPISAIFGGNASGKSNFFKSIKFAQNLIISGTKVGEKIPVIPFKLEQSNTELPTKFNFVLLADERIYEYGFSVTQQSVLYEKLSIIHPKRETLLYERKKDKFDFHGTLKKNELVKIVSANLRSNQLFISSIVDFTIPEPLPVFNWFKNSLVTISPNSRLKFDTLLENTEILDFVNNSISTLDCGIDQIGSESIIANATTENSDEDTYSADSTNKKNSIDCSDKYAVISKKDNQIHTKRLVTFHTSKSGNEVKFYLAEESDGTIRLLDLLPKFVDLSNQNSSKIFVIDELDRSLHTQMTRALIEAYLENCTSNSKSQLIFTSHDVQLINPFMFRQDEILFTERQHNGSTIIKSLEMFGKRESKNELRYDYLIGRFGGVPKIHLGALDLDIKQDGANNKEK